MDHTTAQHLFMKGEAVFMSNGAWLQMEMSANYKEEAGNMTMIATPVISALGVKLGLDGKGGTDANR
jgi:maltose-binding protein MalE